MSPSSKADNNKIDEYINVEINSANIPGLVIGIIKGDDVYVKGYVNVDNNGRLVTPSPPFIMGSLSKSFTALAIMKLKAETSKITVRNRLNQTSVFSTYSGSTQFAAL